ncbi:MAG TPA: zinc ABC transporter substrate-binding protein [Candidatus Acidoferrales bacterium]|nr:zinc ABC transporter substrate-binding protein [Candidatus Acidoferrales bacterium]
MRILRYLGTLAVGAVVACAAPAAPSTTATGAPAAQNTTAPGAPAAPTATGPVINVLGTENFYADLLSQIGGSQVKATSILNDPNADPHEYEASPAAAKAVADASLVVVNDVGYDDFMQKLLSGADKPDRIVINVQQTLRLADDVNPHVWYDPGTMPKVADAVVAGLTKLEPQNAAYFKANEQKYLTAIKAIDDKIAALKAKYSGVPIAFTEDVAGYMTDAIGLKVLTPEGFMHAIEQGTDPAPADVAAERDLITGHKVKVLVYNSQVTSPVTQGIHDLAQQNNVPIVGVAETIPTEFKTFQEWQLAQLDALEKALAKG